VLGKVIIIMQVQAFLRVTGLSQGREEPYARPCSPSLVIYRARTHAWAMTEGKSAPHALAEC